MRKITITLLLLATLVGLLKADNYTLVLLSQDSGAACLDGSPVGLYINQGKGANKDNFLIYFIIRLKFEGVRSIVIGRILKLIGVENQFWRNDSGGFCGAGNLSDTLQSCYQRSNGGLGSTKNAKPSVNADQGGLLSTDPEQNPVFYDWTKVFAIYCDGAQYFGSRPQPVPYKDKKLYFRGTNNVLEQVKYLEYRFDIFRKNKIVITGVSAGGIATYLYSNHFLAKTVTAKIYAMPDSGLFLTDYYSPLAGQKIIRQRSRALLDLVWTEQRYPIEACLDEFKNDTIMCFNAQNLIKYIKVPMLIIQSPYDQWSISNLLGATCLVNKKPPFSLMGCNQTELKVINDYRDASRVAIEKMIQTKPQTGVWAPSCVQHGFTDAPSFNDPHYKIPTDTGKSIPQTVMQFLENPQKPPIVIDRVNWPENTGCNGISAGSNLRARFDYY